MKPIKALFFDVDSTLYTHRIHDFPNSTKEALIRLKENGYKIGIATSRCRAETRNLPTFFRTFEFDAKIYDGGALVMEKDEVIVKSPVAEQQIRALMKYAHNENIPVRYSTFDANYIDKDCSWDIKDEFFKLYLNMPLIKPYEGEEVFNILAYPKTKKQEEAIYHFLHSCSIVKHQKPIEITAEGINKSIGVKALTKHWNLTMDEIICFGDGENDVIMLEEAGLGIAMGNASPTVKVAADRICGHIDDDGLYSMCKELNLL